MKLQKIKAFTLVELIIVITILAILATIGFMSFQSYTLDARDSNRITSIGELKKGLELSFIKDSKYPAPEGDIVLSGSINNQILTYVGELGANISKTVKFTSIPKDPLTQTNYIYGTTSDYKYYQVASILEGDTAYTPIINTTYANTETAKVEGNYPGFIKFNSGANNEESRIANIPSLIFNNTGSVSDLLANTTYFVVNKKSNLPYNTKGIKDTSIQKLDGNNLIKEITGTGTASLTGVNITNLEESNFETIFTGVTLASFNISGGDLANKETIVSSLKTSILGTSATASTKVYTNCTLSGETISHGNSITAFAENTIIWNASYDCTARSQTRTCNDGVLSGTETYGYTSCVKGTVNNCSANASFVYNGHTYSIPALNHGSGTTNILSSNVSINNGTFKYTLENIECNDGTYVSINENATPTVQSCDLGFGINGNICSASQNGVCNNTVALGCTTGSPINDNGSTNCGTTRTWKCSGVYGGNESVQCSKANASCSGTRVYQGGPWSHETGVCYPNNYTSGHSVSGRCTNIGSINTYITSYSEPSRCGRGYSRNTATWKCQ